MHIKRSVNMYSDQQPALIVHNKTWVCKCLPLHFFLLVLFIYRPDVWTTLWVSINRRPTESQVASRFAQRFVNLVVGANLTDTSDKLTDRYADRQTVPDSINCIILAPVMDIALARVLIAQSSLEMLSCAVFKLCCQNFALFCRWCFEFFLFFSHITTRKRMAAMGEAKALLVCNPVVSA